MTDPAPSEPSPAWADRINRLRSALPVSVSGRALAAGAAAGLLVVVVVMILVLHRSGGPPPLELPRAGGRAPAPAPEPAAPGADHSGDTITVHAAGAVARPGVYVVPGRARVADVLAAAGGTRADADVDQLNLAAKLTDAQRIYVPRKGETAPAPPQPAGGSPTGGGGAGAGGSAGPIDLNTADATQLDVLPGVGPTTAKAIVAYRSAHGRFRSVTDLLGVPGIGPAKLDAIRPLVTVAAA